MAGLGAWSFGFYAEGMAVPNDRVAAGILAFKHALVDNGYGTGIDLSLAKFGHAMHKQTVKFQLAQGLTEDGVIGPVTARFLFRYYSSLAEGTYAIPAHLVQKAGGAESGHDPVAEGYYDPGDEGWAQIHLSSHPDVTLAEAWSPGFAIPWMARAFKSFYHTEIADWDGAVAAYNEGSYYAKKWVLAGKPASGGPVINDEDMWVRATTYVARVKAQSV